MAMKNIIAAGMKNAKPVGKSVPKRYYTLTNPKQRDAASALKVLGALNSLTHVFKTIGTYARKVVFDTVLPSWLKDVVSGKKKIEAFTVSTGDSKALVVPMKKYAIIDEERAAKLEDLKDKYKFELEVVEHQHFVFNDRLISQIPEEKMSKFIEEVKEALLKATTIPAGVKKDIRSGKLSVIEERLDYDYNEDVLTNLSKYSKGDPKKALEILEVVKPVFALRSFEMQDKEDQVVGALDLIKENIELAEKGEE